MDIRTLALLGARLLDFPIAQDQTTNGFFCDYCKTDLDEFPLTLGEFLELAGRHLLECVEEVEDG